MYTNTITPTPNDPALITFNSLDRTFTVYGTDVTTPGDYTITVNAFSAFTGN